MYHISFIQMMPNIFRQPTVIASLASLGIHGILGVSMPISAHSKAKQPLHQRTIALVESTPMPEKSQSEEMDAQLMNIPPVSEHFIKLPPILPPSYQSIIPQIDKNHLVYNVEADNISKVPKVTPSSPTRIKPDLTNRNYIAYRISKYTTFKNNKFSMRKENKSLVQIQTADKTPASIQFNNVQKMPVNEISTLQLPQINGNIDYIQPRNQDYKDIPLKTNSNTNFIKIPIFQSQEQINSQESQPVIIANNSPEYIKITDEQARKKYTDFLLTVPKAKTEKDNFISQNYPLVACSKKLEATVTIGTLVDVNGKSVQEPQLIKSSGYHIFNQQAINDVKNRKFLNKTKNSQPYLINVIFKYNQANCPDLNVSMPIPKSNIQSFWWEPPVLKMGGDWQPLIY